MTQIEKSLNN